MENKDTLKDKDIIKKKEPITRVIEAPNIDLNDELTKKIYEVLLATGAVQPAGAVVTLGATTMTEHLELNQWEPEDVPVRMDFNEDNQKIDTAFYELNDNLSQSIATVKDDLSHIDETWEQLTSKDTDVSVNGGWVNLPLLNGFTNPAGLRYRVYMGVVYIQIHDLRTPVRAAGALAALACAVMPEDLRPSNNNSSALMSGMPLAVDGSLVVRANGNLEITVNRATTATTAVFATASYPLQRHH